MAVNPSVLRFSIDLQNYDRPFVVNVKQGTNRTKLVITILDGGAPYLFEEDTQVTFSQVTPKGNHVTAGCDIKDNLIILTLPPASTAEEGESDCEFTFTDENNTVITSPHITLYAHLSLLHEYASTAIQSDSFGVLTEATTAALNARKKAEEAADRADDISEELTQKKDAGEFNGKSAYEIAKENGFSGSEEDWLKARNPSVDGHTLILPYVELGE